MRFIIPLLLLSFMVNDCYSQSASGLIEEGKSKLSWLNDDDNKKAVELLTRAIEIDENNALAYYWRGKAYNFLKEYINAYQDYTKAKSLDSYNEMILIDRANLGLSIGSSLFYTNLNEVRNKEDYLKNSVLDYTEYMRLLDIETSLGFLRYLHALDQRASAKANLSDYYGAINDLSQYLELAEEDLSKSDSFFLKEESRSRAITDIAHIYSRRALYMKEIGQLRSACLDWSKAGELGLSNAYSNINRYCQ